MRAWSMFHVDLTRFNGLARRPAELIINKYPPTGGRAAEVQSTAEARNWQDSYPAWSSSTPYLESPRGDGMVSRSTGPGDVFYNHSSSTHRCTRFPCLAHSRIRNVRILPIHYLEEVGTVCSITYFIWAWLDHMPIFQDDGRLGCYDKPCTAGTTLGCLSCDFPMTLVLLLLLSSWFFVGLSSPGRGLTRVGSLAGSGSLADLAAKAL